MDVRGLRSTERTSPASVISEISSVSTVKVAPERVLRSTLRSFPVIGALAPLWTSMRAPRRAPRNSDCERFLPKSQAQGGQAARQRSFGIVIDAGDAATGKIENGEGLQHVVQLGAGEINVDISCMPLTRPRCSK